MTDTPSYEELRDKQYRGRPQIWATLVLALEPGEVQPVERHGRNESTAQRGIKQAATAAGLRVITRTVDGVLYVVRLRDEDVPK